MWPIRGLADPSSATTVEIVRRLRRAMPAPLPRHVSDTRVEILVETAIHRMAHFERELERRQVAARDVERELAVLVDALTAMLTGPSS